MLLKLERGTVEHPQQTRNRTIFDKVVKREFSAGFGYHLMDPLRVARVFVVCLRHRTYTLWNPCRTDREIKHRNSL